MANLTKAQRDAVDAIQRYPDLLLTEIGSRGGWTVDDTRFPIHARVANALLAQGIIEPDPTRKSTAEHWPGMGLAKMHPYRLNAALLGDRDAAPLSDAEQRRLGKANAYALDWMDDGGTLPPEIDRLVNQTARKLTPEEGRRMIAWMDKVAGE